MKQNLNISRHVSVAGAILALAGLTVSSAEKPPIPGKDLLHFAIHERMLNEGAVARASGQLDLHVDTHGNKSHEDLHLHLRGLDPTATYQLGAQLNGDSNVTQVVTFTPDREGNSDIHLREKGPKNPKSKNGHVDAQLPPELQPVTLIDQLLVSDTSGVAVLTADLTAPDHFEYLAKRDLSAGDIQARLDIKSNNHKAQVHLTAKGLEAGSEYSLALNGNVAGSETANHDGKVDLRAELQNVADIFALQTVALLDASSNTVVSATLP